MKFNSFMSGLRRACAVLCVFALVPGLASAQAPAAIEGKIESITVNADGSANVVVMGVDVFVPASLFGSKDALGNVIEQTLATTPTGEIWDANDLLGDSLPGRGEWSGFMNGTAIINGTSTTRAVLAVDGSILEITPGFIAADLFVEPAENVILGALQNGAGCKLYMEGVPLVFLNAENTAGRMAAGMPINGAGFEVDPCGLPENGGAGAVEGYYGNDGSLYVFAFESDDAPIVQTEAGGTTTITRASCDGRRIEVRGSSTLASGSAHVFAPDNSIEGWTELTSGALTLDALTNTSTYRLRVNIAVCPEEVRVESWNDAGELDSSVIGPVDLR